MAGAYRRRAAGLYQRRAVRAQPGADGRQPGPRREPGRAARRPRAAGRAGGLRDLRSPDAGELRNQPAGADRALLLPAPPSHLRRAALPADGRTVPRRPCRRPAPVGAGPGRPGAVGHRRPAGRGPPGRGRPDLAAAPGTRGLRLRPGAAPVPAGRAGEPPGGPPARARVGSRAGRAGAAGRGVRAVPAAAPGPAVARRTGRDPRPGRATSRRCGPRRRPPSPTASGCCVPSSSPSRSPPTAPPSASRPP